MKSKIFQNKILYWILCTVLILLLFILIGGVTFIFSEKGFMVQSFIGLIFGIIGAVLVTLAIYKPLSLYGFTKPTFYTKDKNIMKGIATFHVFWGFSFLIGGICYLKYNSIFILLFFLLLPVAFLGIRLRIRSGLN